MKTASCRSCGAPILFAVTEMGKRIPLNAEPVEGEPDQRGLFMLVKRLDDTPFAWPFARSNDGPNGHGIALYVSHFASCPDASNHRRRA